jgi:hypothetical protein
VVIIFHRGHDLVLFLNGSNTGVGEHSQRAFVQHGRAMLASDVVQALGPAFREWFEATD